MPTETDRASIASEIAGIERALAPGDRQQIIALIAGMMLAFPVAGADEETIGSRLDIYAANVADLPAWAVDAGCQSLMRGTAGGKAAYLPSAPELRIKAVEATAPHRAMIAKLNRVLAAEPMQRVTRTPEARERMAQKAGDWLAKFDGKVRDEKFRTAQYHDETAKRAKA
jgi:hypothetical protein